MKISKNNIILLAILIVAGLYTYFFEYKHSESVKQTQEKAKLLIKYDKDSITNIYIKNIFGDFQFKKTESGKWMLEEPVQTLADEQTVKAILSDFAGIKRSDEVEPFKAENLSDFGFGNLSGKVVFGSKTERDSLILGDNTPVGNNMFVTKNDSVVYGIPKYKKNSVNKNLYDYRDKKILHFSQSAIDKIELIAGKKSIKLEKSEGNKWTVNGKRADKSKINTLLSRFSNDTFKKVLSETFNGKSFHLNRPLRKLILHETAAANTHHLMLGGKADAQTVAAKDADRPMVFAIDTTLANKLKSDVDFWRDRQFVNLNSGEIDSMVFRLPDSTIVLKKDSTQWFWQSDTGKVKIKNWKVTSLLADLKNLKISHFVAPFSKKAVKFGLDKPRIRILGFSSNFQKFTTSFGIRSNNQRYAISNRLNEIVTIPVEDVEKLIPHKKDFLQ